MTHCHFYISAQKLCNNKKIHFRILVWPIKHCDLLYLKASFFIVNVRYLVLFFWLLMNLYNDSIFQTIIIMMISWVITVERKEVPSSALRIEMASLDEHGWKRNINLRWWTYTTKTKVWLHMFFLVLYPAFSVKTWMPYYDKSAGEIILNWILDIYYMTVLLVFLERERVKKSQYVSKKTVKM